MFYPSNRTIQTEAEWKGRDERRKAHCKRSCVFARRDKSVEDFPDTQFPTLLFGKRLQYRQTCRYSRQADAPFHENHERGSERVTFLRDPFEKFAKDHVKLRVLTGVLKGQEGYIVRILRDRQLVMEFGGYAVAISNVHREDFEIAE